MIRKLLSQICRQKSIFRTKLVGLFFGWQLGTLKVARLIMRLQTPVYFQKYSRKEYYCYQDDGVKRSLSYFLDIRLFSCSNTIFVLLFIIFAGGCWKPVSVDLQTLLKTIPPEFITKTKSMRSYLEIQESNNLDHTQSKVKYKKINPLQYNEQCIFEIYSKLLY